MNRGVQLLTIYKKIVEYLNQIWYLIVRGKKTNKGDNMAKINDNLENLANDILLKNDMFRLPVDLIKLAKNNNIDVYYTELPAQISGAIRYNKNKHKFEILIDATESKSRQRFTLAHELAHFFLEGELLSESQDIHFDTLYRKNKNPHEVEVEYLAGAILMDRKMVTTLYNLYPSVSLLAKTFFVSESAMTVRLMVLGLI